MQTYTAWLKPAAWGFVGGAIVTMIVGFSWGGWTTHSTTERIATERASSTLVVALTPSCVASFMKQPGATVKLTEFQKIDSSWNQRQLIEKGGWATPSGEKEPNSALATSCAEALTKVKA
jgi:hypothetical protein